MAVEMLLISSGCLAWGAGVFAAGPAKEPTVQQLKAQKVAEARQAMDGPESRALPRDAELHKKLQPQERIVARQKELIRQQRSDELEASRRKMTQQARPKPGRNELEQACEKLARVAEMRSGAPIKHAFLEATGTCVVGGGQVPEERFTLSDVGPHEL